MIIVKIITIAITLILLIEIIIINKYIYSAVVNQVAYTIKYCCYKLMCSKLYTYTCA